MAYWIYGNDKDTGGSVEIFSDTDREEDAMAEAESQNINVMKLSFMKKSL